MSESSVKSSMKKAFKAPVLKVSNDAVKSNKDDTIDASKIQKRESKSEGKENKQQNKKMFQKMKKEEKKPEEEEESSENKLSPKVIKKIKKKPEKKEDSSEDKISPKKVEKIKKPEVSLTDLQYEEIFKAVLQNPCNQQPAVSLTDLQYDDKFKAVVRNPNSQHTSPLEDILEAITSSSEKSSVKGSHNKSFRGSEVSVKTRESLKEILPQLSPWGSHIRKQPSQASSILKELQESQASSRLKLEPSSSSEDTDGGGDEDVVLSQRSVQQLSQHSKTEKRPTLAPRRRTGVDKRPVLEELQTLRNVGLWVFCDRVTCGKQRYLPDVTDPEDLENIWYCHMNPDPRYNSCSCEEQQPSREEEEDMIDNQFTCGSVVWARVTGFPWWPAIVDDDPDLELYYWLDMEDMRTVTFYHVVFFDKNEVTRAWIPIKDIVSYKKNLYSFKQRVVRGIDFTSRLQVAREQAADAVSLTIVQRLKKYSFIARYKGPIIDDQKQAEKTKKKYKLKTFIGKKEADRRGRKRPANTSEENLTPFEAVVKTNSEKKEHKMRKLSEKGVENKSFAAKNKSDCYINIELPDNAEKKLTKESETASFVLLNSGTNIVMETPESKLSSIMKKPNSNLNPDTRMRDKKVSQKIEGSNESETPSGIFSENVNTGGEITSREKMETETPSVIGSHASQKSKTSSGKAVNTAETGLDDSLGSFIEPSQALYRSHAEEEDSQQNKLSQSTIAEFLATESEEAVVPEANLSQQSEPFEE